MSKQKNIALFTHLIWKEAGGCKLINILKPLVCKGLGMTSFRGFHNQELVKISNILKFASLFFIFSLNDSP